MTTIIFKDGEMYADSQTSSICLSGHKSFSNNATKILKINEKLFGFAGEVLRIEHFITWLRHGIIPNLKGTRSKFSSLEWDGKDLWEWTEDFKRHFNLIKLVIGKDFIRYQFNGYKKVKINKSYYVIGSGKLYAMQSLWAGCSPEEAMKSAMLNDLGTGGKINRRTLKDIIKESHILDPLFDPFPSFTTTSFTSATCTIYNTSSTSTSDCYIWIYHDNTMIKYKSTHNQMSSST